MRHALNVAAIDLGAESGRAILGQFDGKKILLSEEHRFPNEPVQLPDGLHWDVLRLFHEIKKGLRATARTARGDLASVGVDTWGVDFGFLDANGSLLGNPYHYRDPRTRGMMEYAFERVPAGEIFARTGIQFMPLNSLYQLIAMLRSGSGISGRGWLGFASTLLFMPDLFAYFLTGRRTTEWTIASTSQMCDPGKRTWARELLERLGVPQHVLTDIIPPGTRIGPLLDSVAEEIGARPVAVAVAGHDTASAVVAVPAGGTPGDFIYISSGTWSLLGAEVGRPYLDDKTARFNFTNEGGVGGAIRLLKNITGLWLVQQCRCAWQRAGEELSYDELTRLAENAPPRVSFVDPDDEAFVNPPDMPEAIRAFCRHSGQPVPQDKGAVVRCALESLALKYRWTLEGLEEILGRRISTIHIVGGGSKNRLLNQLTADVTGRVVKTGPVEATAIGNLLVQVMALGELGNLGEIREVVRNSFAVDTFEPSGTDAEGWEDAYGEFKAFLETSGSRVVKNEKQ